MGRGGIWCVFYLLGRACGWMGMPIRICVCHSHRPAMCMCYSAIQLLGVGRGDGARAGTGADGEGGTVGSGESPKYVGETFFMMVREFVVVGERMG